MIFDKIGYFIKNGCHSFIYLYIIILCYPKINYYSYTNISVRYITLGSDIDDTWKNVETRYTFVLQPPPAETESRKTHYFLEQK